MTLQQEGRYQLGLSVIPMYGDLSQELFTVAQFLPLGCKPTYVRDKRGERRMMWVSREPDHYIDHEIRGENAQNEGVHRLDDDTEVQSGTIVALIGPRYKSLEDLNASLKQ